MSTNAMVIEFFLLFHSLQDYISHLERVIIHECSSCKKTSYCLACGQDWQIHKSVIDGKSNKDATNTTESHASAASLIILHCKASISVAIGVGLAHIEKTMGLKNPSQYWATLSKRKAEKRGVGSSKKAKVKEQISKEGSAATYDDAELNNYSGFGQTSASAKGVGYAGYSYEDSSWRSAQEAKQLGQDDELQTALRLLRPYLPNIDRKAVKTCQGNVVELTEPLSTDCVEEITVLVHLRRRFLPIASEMLQPRSISEVTTRLRIFQELLEWLCLLGQDDCSACLIAQPIMRFQSFEVLSHNARSLPEVSTTYVASAGPRELVETVAQQAISLRRSLAKSLAREQQIQATWKEGKKSFKAGVSNTKQPDVEKEAQKAKDDLNSVLALCDHIAESVDALDAALRRMKGSAFVMKLLSSFRPWAERQQDDSEEFGKVTALESEQLEQDVTQEAYEKWARSVIFDEANMVVEAPSSTGPDGPAYHHAFHEKIAQSNTHVDSKRNLVISKELAGLCSSLPADWYGAIFVRVDES